MNVPRRPARLVFAGGVAVAIAIAPALPVFTGAVVSPAARSVAQPGDNCTKNHTNGGSYSLACSPDMSFGGAPGAYNGAPTESGLTEKNAHR
ncbi:MAG: hypothetical protein JWR32_4010 [Mycobacterium sp.]|jgi:hypothetical protein|nr:hypothetical protein [Mycobacterium sp.]